ncbi:MAG: lytic transglycosylase domain-containing protein [Bdellovibrionota bacterium]|jgi:hypothetical protein
MDTFIFKRVNTPCENTPMIVSCSEESNQRINYNRTSCTRPFSTLKRGVVSLTVTLSLLTLTGCGFFDRNFSMVEELAVKDYDSRRASMAPLYIKRQRPVTLPKLAIPDNIEINREMHRLLGRERKFMERAFRKQREYRAVLEELLQDEGVPGELLALAIVESALDHNARSRAGAVGMWQFMKGTAQEYDLRVDMFDDERKDPILSTIAAARMLQDMHKRFGSWELALAAYNCGPGGVQRQINAANGETDFWVLSRRGFFNRETRAFVPRVFATAAILRDPKRYGF